MSGQATEWPIESYVPQEASAEQLAALVDLRLARWADLRPEDPLPSRAQMEASYLAPMTHGWEARVLAARSGTTYVGTAGWRINVTDSPHEAWLDVYVAPAVRRQGLGRHLLDATLTELATERGVTTVGFGVGADVAIGREIQRLVEDRWGLPVRMEERVSRLDLDTVDRALLRAQANERWARLAPGYRHVFFALDEVPAPDTGFRLADYLAMVEEIENLMPSEALDEVHETYDEARFRAQVASQRAQERTIWNVVAQDGAGRCVGTTNINFDTGDPRLVQQWNTGVLRAHWGHGLGMVMKLEMLARLTAEVPGARFVDTENAYSNAAMIKINDTLGFKEHRRVHAYQTQLATLRAVAGLPMRGAAPRLE